MTTGTPKTARQYFKTLGLAKPLSPTAQPLLQAPRPTALPGRLPTTPTSRLPTAARLDIGKTPTRHRQDIDKTTTLRPCLATIAALAYTIHPSPSTVCSTINSVTCPLGTSIQSDPGEQAIGPWPQGLTQASKLTKLSIHPSREDTLSRMHAS